MQNFSNSGLNAGAQFTHGGQVQRPRQIQNYVEYLALPRIATIGHILRVSGRRENLSYVQMPAILSNSIMLEEKSLRNTSNISFTYII